MLVVWAKKHGLKYKALDVVWKEQREVSTIPSLRALLTMFADLIVLRLVALVTKYAALQRHPVGDVVA